MKKLMILMVLCVVACNPLKVTDPNDPKFDINQFEFNDHRARDDIAEVFMKAFPIGTEKSFIDSILIDAAGAKSERSKTYKNLVIYYEPWSLHWKKPRHFNFTYDDQDRLINIWPGNFPNLYQEQPDYKNLNSGENDGN